MARQHAVSRRQFLAGSAAAAAALATRRDALAQAPVPAQKFHAKPVPADIFIDHGINQETRLETLRGYLTPTSHFFIRHHATPPSLDARTWRLRVEGNGVAPRVVPGRRPEANPHRIRMTGPRHRR